MFSGLSKLADKSFVLGYFLPALIGVLAFIALNRDFEPLTRLSQDSLQNKTFANLTVMLLGVWTLSVVLMVLSHNMYRVLEGYTWPLNRLWLLERQLKCWERRSKEVRDAHNAISRAEELVQAAVDTAARKDLQRQLDERKLTYMGLRRKLVLEYPKHRGVVLSTRLGNVLRAFEMYASEVYGVESIHAWPRLLAAVPKDYQAKLADARASVDFFVSLVFISFALGFVALARGGISLFTGHGGAMPWIFFGITAITFIASRWCYQTAVSSAVEWGEVVKSAFDLYLPALANALGYELPKTAKKRRQFWEAWDNQFRSWMPVRPEDWPASAIPPATAEGCEPKHPGNPGKGEDVDNTDAERDEE